MSSDSDYDPVAFRAFEHEGWEQLGSGYQRWVAELTLQAAEPLLTGTNVIAGSRVLDVATGPGLIAQAAANRGAKAPVGPPNRLRRMCTARRKSGRKRTSRAGALGR